MLNPLGDRVVIEPMDPLSKSKGGVILPQAHQEKPQEGTAIAVGPGKWEHGEFIATTIKVGDRVIYSKFSGSELTYHDKKLLIIPERDCLAVADPEE
jgi:chaperonin GroES